MKKLFYLAITACAAFALGCTPVEEESEIQQEEYTPATLTINPSALSVAKTKGASATAAIESDSDVLSVNVNYDSRSWLSAKIEGTTLTVTTTAANPFAVTREGKVTVAAGKGINTTEVVVTVTQALEDDIPPTITLGAKEAELTGAKDALAIIAWESNVTNVVVKVADDAKEWLKAEIDAKNITLTTLSENTTGAARTTTVNVVATNAKGTALTETIAVTQAKKAEAIGIGATVEGGVLFWISEDGTKGKVLYPYGEKLAWSPKVIDGASADVPEAVDKEDGTVNVAAMKDFATAKGVDFAATFPAAAYCDNIAGGGWYLPASGELNTLFEAYNGTSTGDATNDNHENVTAAELASRLAFEGYIKAAGGENAVVLDVKKGSGDSAFASNQKTNANAFYVRWGKYLCDGGGKHSISRYARCIKVVNL